MITIIDGEVILNTDKNCDLPFCNLLFTNRESIHTLINNDVQGLIQSISNGDCILKGQVEPFIYFFARFVDWQNLKTDFV